MPHANFARMAMQAGFMDKARLHVRRHFSRKIPEWMRFHDLEHTLSVVRTAMEIGRASGLAAKHLRLLELAALFHDTGYASAYKGHEEASARSAAAYLLRHGMHKASVVKVSALILATRMGQKPVGLLQRVLRDADSAKAGQSDFFEKSERLRLELEHTKGKRIGPAAWRLENRSYLEAHRFHTAYARRRFGKQKRINMDLLDQAIDGPRLRSRTSVPALPEPFMDRDVSWLSFNARVLQEAEDPQVPLLERLKFVAIHSSNLDEFYRVRVAQLRSLRKLGKWNRSALDVPPEKRLAKINQEALRQQDRLGKLYRNTLIPALRAQDIRFRRERQLSRLQKDFVLLLFKERIAPLLQTVTMRRSSISIIEDRRIYLVFALSQKGKHRSAIMNVPTAELGRFITLPSTKGRIDLMYLEDALRLGATSYFMGWTIKDSHAIKLSRDAELYLEDEFAEHVVDKVRRSLRKRRTGMTARFLYDGAMPATMLGHLRRSLDVKKGEMLKGGRYHNLSDLARLPIPGRADLRETPLHPLPHPALIGKDPFALIRSGDILLHFPYHDFDTVVKLVQRAVNDANVRRIAITLYRVAARSLICQALVEAARKGKRVEVLMEVQARFDEDNNLYWGEALEKAGARVIYGLDGYKVHGKLCLMERQEGKLLARYAYLGTGNFNESTARLYADMGLLTARKAMTREVAQVLDNLMTAKLPGATKLLRLAPHALRGELERAIDQEIAQALLGKPASILLKLNSIEDKTLIRKLYDADRAGVEVRLIVRGICCLVTEVPGHSENIKAISIVDRFLEHSRVYVFHNGGSPTVHLASADWMERNLDRRVEVAFPVLDAKLKVEVLRFLELEWQDNVKARSIDREQSNPYRIQAEGKPVVRSQTVWYAMLKRAADRMPIPSRRKWAR